MNTAPAHRHVQSARVPTPGLQPLTTRPATTLVDIIRREPRASRGLDAPVTARSPR